MRTAPGFAREHGDGAAEIALDVEDETAAILSEQLHEERVHGAGRFAGADRAENDDVLRGVRDRQGDLRAAARCRRYGRAR